jgi:hypothetical protein
MDHNFFSDRFFVNDLTEIKRTVAIPDFFQEFASTLMIFWTLCQSKTKHKECTKTREEKYGK